MLKRILSTIFGSKNSDSIPNARNSGETQETIKTGLWVFSDFGEIEQFITEAPTEFHIRETIEALDWIGRFHQVVLVKPDNESLEVGGSTNPEDGLSSVYINPNKGQHLVTRAPPTTVGEMIDLLISFHREDGHWNEMYVFE